MARWRPIREIMEEVWSRLRGLRDGSITPTFAGRLAGRLPSLEWQLTNPAEGSGQSHAARCVWPGAVESAGRYAPAHGRDARCGRFPER